MIETTSEGLVIVLPGLPYFLFPTPCRQPVDRHVGHDFIVPGTLKTCPTVDVRQLLICRSLATENRLPEQGQEETGKASETADVPETPEASEEKPTTRRIEPNGP